MIENVSFFLLPVLFWLVVLDSFFIFLFTFFLGPLFYTILKNHVYTIVIDKIYALFITIWLNIMCEMIINELIFYNKQKQLRRDAAKLLNPKKELKKCSIILTMEFYFCCCMLVITCFFSFDFLLSLAFVCFCFSFVLV